MTYQRYGISAEVLSGKTVDFDVATGYLLSPFGPYPVVTNETKQSVGQSFIDTYRNEIPQAIIDEFAKAGITVSNVSVVNITYEWVIKDTHTWYIPPFTAQQANACQIRILWDARFDTDKDLGHSPLDPLTWAIIIKIISVIGTFVIAALISYWIIQAVKDCVQSLYTSTSTVTTYDPVTGLPIKTEKTQTPDALGQIVVVIAVLGVAAIGGYFALQYFGKGKGRRK